MTEQRSEKPCARCAELQKKLATLEEQLTAPAPAGESKFLKIQAVTPRGEFWAIGRQFKEKPTMIAKADLKPEELADLRKVLPQHLSVVEC